MGNHLLLYSVLRNGRKNSSGRADFRAAPSAGHRAIPRPAPDLKHGTNGDAGTIMLRSAADVATRQPVRNPDQALRTAPDSGSAATNSCRRAPDHGTGQTTA